MPAHSVEQPTRRRWALAFGAVLACAIFLALGTWQVERRAWKLALIERVEQRVHAPAVPLPPADRWAQVNAAADEYRHVRVSGTWLHESETLVQATTALGAGFWVLTPLRLSDGSVVLVNRGFVSPERRERSTRVGVAQVTLSGLLRISEPGGGFLRSNDAAANRWYSRDMQAIAAARDLQGAAPFFIDADADPVADPSAPVAGLTVISFNNHHAVYALTWYALALMSAWAAWRVLREPQSPR